MKMARNPGGQEQETVADVSWFNAKPSNSSQVNSKPTSDETCSMAQPTQEPTPRVPFHKYSFDYDMTGKKIMIILNHYEYQKTKYFRNKRPSLREGTAHDVAKLKSTFGRRGFTVVVYNELPHSQILAVMSKVCSEDHKNTSCVAVAILTHGKNDEVYAADRPYLLSDIINPLQNGHPSLVGKPKLVFVQACRGGNMDDGRRVQTDGGQDIILPTHADTLIMHSTQHFLSDGEGLESSGSRLIQSLCDVIDEHHKLFDLNSILTLVNQRVEHLATLTPENPKTNNQRQIPEVTQSLTKFVRL